MKGHRPGMISYFWEIDKSSWVLQFASVKHNVCFSDSEYQPNHQEPQSSTYKMLKGIIKGSEDPSARNNNFFQGIILYSNIYLLPP